jgi:hypothetical protein
MSSFNECAQCIDIGDVACVDRLDRRVSYCCDGQGEDVDEMCSSRDGWNGINFGLCSNEVRSPTMKYFTCPYQERFCGNSNDSFVVLEPEVYRKNMTSFGAAGRDFRDNQQCYYSVTAKNGTFNSTRRYNYFIDVNVTLMEGVWGILHNGTHPQWAGNATEIEPEF